MPASVVWSPYYRIDVEPASLSDEGGNLYPMGYHIRVNHDGFMGAYDHRPEFIEQLPTEVMAWGINSLNLIAVAAYAGVAMTAIQIFDLSLFAYAKT